MTMRKYLIFFALLYFIFFSIVINLILSMKSIFSNQIVVNTMMLARSKDANGIFSNVYLMNFSSVEIYFSFSSLFCLKCSFTFFFILILIQMDISLFTAFNYSGGYFNPILATALKWGCSGYSNIDHIIVYWIGACSGAILSVPLYKYDVIKKLVGEESLAQLKPKAD